MTQTLTRTKRTLSFYTTKQLEASHAKRKADTRTKVQLGGLVIKSGLAEAFSISQGSDLQLDETEKEKATLLLGALIDLCQSIANDSPSPSQKEEWTHLEKAAFMPLLKGKHRSWNLISIRPSKSSPKKQNIYRRTGAIILRR